MSLPREDELDGATTTFFYMRTRKKTIDREALNSCVCIVLGVYNGSEYLKDQIDSILSQHGPPWRILSRDDGSQDNSPAILKEYSAQESRILFLQDNAGNVGTTRNFSFLMEKAFHSSYKYVALSDQDDVWNQNKLKVQLSLMQKAEQKYPGEAVLIHSDLEVVDADLNLISSSFMRYKGIRHETSHPLKVLLANNFVTGCTVLMNRRLLELALPFPKETVVHDWWLALCAAVFGHIEYIDKPSVKYRQHKNNEIGANSTFDLMNPFKKNVYQYCLKARNILSQTIAQSKALSERVKEHDPFNPHLTFIERYASLRNLSTFQRIKTLNSLGVHGQGYLRHLFLEARLISLPTQKKHADDVNRKYKHTL